MREKRGADTDEHVRTKTGGLSGNLALQANRAAEQRREQQLEQQRQSQSLADRAERVLEKRV
jgi:hypothetical protein